MAALTDFPFSFLLYSHMYGWSSHIQVITHSFLESIETHANSRNQTTATTYCHDFHNIFEDDNAKNLHLFQFMSALSLILS